MSPADQPRHPGTILVSSFLEPIGITQYRVAVDIGVPPRRINEIVHGKRAISADTAVRLGRYFGNDPHYWLDLQARFDIARAREALGARLEADVLVRESAPRQVTPPPSRGTASSQPKTKIRSTQPRASRKQEPVEEAPVKEPPPPYRARERLADHLL